MGVSVRAAGIVLLSVLAFLPRAAEAAPIIIEQTITDPLNAGLLEGTFTFDNDVALFHFFLGEGTFTFTVASTSAATGFDPILALFGPDGAPVTYTTPDGGLFPAIGFGDFLDSDAALPLLTLAGGFTYTLAVTQFGPEFGNFPKDTLADGFELDGDEFRCFTIVDPETPCEAGALGMFGGQLASFSLDLTVTREDTAQVPEPGTWSLMAVGMAGTALFRRRRPRHHSNPL